MTVMWTGLNFVRKIGHWKHAPNLLESFTVLFHSPNGWQFAVRSLWNSHRSSEPKIHCKLPRIQCSLGIFQSILKSTNHRADNTSQCTYYQIRKIAGCACAGNAWNVFPVIRGVSDPGVHHGTCVTHVPWCMPGELNSGFLGSWWRGKHSRHSWRMRNPQFCVSGMRPIGGHIS